MICVFFFSNIMINMFGIKYILFVVVYQDYINICKFMIETINIIIYVLSDVQMFMPFIWTHDKDSFKLLPIGRKRNAVQCCSRGLFRKKVTLTIFCIITLIHIHVCLRLLFNATVLVIYRVQRNFNEKQFIFRFSKTSFVIYMLRHFQYVFKMLLILMQIFIFANIWKCDR